MTVDALLSVQDLSLTLPRGGDRHHAVDGASLTLLPGQLHCLVGESGSGKSMMALAIMRLLPGSIRHTAGRVMFQGSDLMALPERRMHALRGRVISMVFQEPMTALNPSFRIGDQLGEVYRTHTTLSRAARLDKAQEILAAVGLKEIDRISASYPHQLSGGQRQRVMIAMALALRPAVLVADEPTTALDVTTQATILRLIRDLQREQGTSVLFITHDFGVVAEIADCVSVMRQGRIVETGAADRVLRAPEQPYTRELIAAVPRLDRASDRQPRTKPPQDPVLTVSGASKTYSDGSFFRTRRSVAALKQVSLEVSPGETLGIVGESGSGKSTLARCIVRLDRVEQGSIAIGPIDVAGARGAELKQMRSAVQMAFQDPYGSLDQRRTVESILCEGPSNFGVPRREARQRAVELLERVGLPATTLHRYPNEFSGGQRQRLCIARALSLRPKLLVADEAVSALDVSVQRQVLSLLNELRQELDLSMVFITHDLRVAAEVCDTIAVMFKGEIVERGRPGEILKHPREAYTRALLDAVPGRHVFG